MSKIEEISNDFLGISKNDKLKETKKVKSETNELVEKIDRKLVTESGKTLLKD